MLEAERKTRTEIIPEFDFDNYTFYDNETMYKIQYISEQYVKQGQINSEKIRKMLFQTIYDQVLNKVSEEFHVDSFSKKNVELWTKLFLRVKTIQSLVKEMTEKVEFELRKELIHNKDQLKAYLDIPRLSDSNMQLVPPHLKKKLPFDDLG